MYSEQDFIKIDQCDMCQSSEKELFYMISGGGADDVLENEFDKKVSVMRCKKCGFVYCQELLSQSGKEKFWRDYSSRVHEITVEVMNKRSDMYKLEYDYIRQFMDENKKNDILDVGCAEGGFLDLFSENCNCYGVEIGEDAFKKASKKHIIYQGELHQLEIKERFDLIIFRGVIQYFETPIKYFETAIDLLKPGGFIFITSTPRADSFVHKLFKERFTLPVCAVAGKGFTVEVLNKYFSEQGLRLCGEKYFYEETPYANMVEDIEKVSKAMDYLKAAKSIDFKAPAF